MLLASFIAGRLLLSPADLVKIEYQIGTGLSFVSNIYFWRQIGYFDAAAETKPLLHLWSLGVEEQFYALWPLLLWLAYRARISLLLAVGLIGLLSFAANLLLVKSNFLDAFYLPQARFWELATGALLAGPWATAWRGRLASLRARHLSLAGLGLIVTALVVVSAGQSYPGWRALLPTLGAALVIAADERSWISRTVLSHPVMVGVGLVSYPLYLWHWPLLAFSRIVLRGEPSATTRIALIALAALLSWLTYRLIESPIRFGRGRQARWNVALPVSAVALGLFAMGSAYKNTRDWVTVSAALALSENQQRLLVDLRQASATKDTFQNLYGDRPCFKYRVDQTIAMFLANGCLDPIDAGRESILLIGDSHSASLSLGLRPFVESKGFNFLQVSTGFCEPTSNDPNDAVCIAINQEVRGRIRSIRPRMVILDTSWVFASQPPYFLGNTGYYRHLLGFVSQLLADGAGKVVVIGQIPAWVEAMPDYLAKNFVLKGQAIPERTYQGVLPEALNIDDVMRSLRYPDRVTYLSLRDVLCDVADCLTHVGPNFTTDVTLWDYGHLTTAAAGYVVGKLFEPAWPALTSE